MSTITSKFAEYQSDIAACFKGSDHDAMSKVCQALEHYVNEVGRGDDRVERGIDGLEVLILQRAIKRASVTDSFDKVNEIAKRYGREVTR